RLLAITIMCNPAGISASLLTMSLLRFIKLALFAALLLLAGLLLYGLARNHPEDLPWTGLDLARPVGAFTGRKLAGLADDPARCRVLLARAGVPVTALPARN